jgi:hypothetical protein
MSFWHYYCIILTIDSFSLIADKAKPRVIVGRKATGPDGIAGLPKQDQRDRIPAAFLSEGDPVFDYREILCERSF